MARKKRNKFLCYVRRKREKNIKEVRKEKGEYIFCN